MTATTKNKMRKTLHDIYSQSLTQSEKKFLIQTLQVRWGLNYSNTMRRVKLGILPEEYTDFLDYLWYYHAVGFDHKKGHFIDYERKEEIQQKGLPMAFL